eukprot:TRINITY_DN19534_c0_g1_i1.p1 TRINITY_DN19534_c0_g1~~TRINITY_DN19534_c0_g1_i1.p1  ORF type:complete len:556 (+),score=93.64 TRINITY_DN19534_c0_g1_i1:140-1669(+)
MSYMFSNVAEPTGVSARVKPEMANLSNVPALDAYDPSRKEKKLQEIHNGGQLLNMFPMMPPRRECQDGAFAALFLFVAAGTLGAGFLYMSRFNNTSRNDDSRFFDMETHDGMKVEDLNKHIFHIIISGLIGSAASLGAAFFFMMLARTYAQCVVYTALYFVSVLMVITGMGMMATGVSRMGQSDSASAIVLVASGGILAAVGACYTACIWCCWGHMIPFTVRVVETVADVAEDHPCMIIVSLMGSICSFVWTIAVFSVLAGVVLKGKKDYAELETHESKGIMAVVVFMLAWGGGVIYNVCHTIYCGVFARWYFRLKARSLLVPSTQVALTTSFGSICLGSLLVAGVRAVEYFVRASQRQAQEEGNIVTCLLLCCLDCLLSIIGDILEYFNEWAYVQCALRGTNFFDSARITYALCTCASMQYIITDLLVDSVVTLGAFFCAICGNMILAMGALMGLIGGTIAGATAMSIFSSGTKTLLAAWTEDPEPLMHSYPEIAQDFSQKLYGARYG